MTLLLKWLLRQGHLAEVADGAEDPFPMESSIMRESAVWSGFTALVGFAVVFRSKIAYERFWAGATSTHQMRAEWFDACSAVIAFTKHSKEPEEKLRRFKHLLVRLFSMLHALALGEIEDSTSDDFLDIEAFKLDLIDVGGIDDESLRTMMHCTSKVELCFQWIQQLIVENIATGVLSIPPPILSRVFQELANGMVQFHEGVKISTIPFPFPYAQTCDLLLMLHWLVTPVVITYWVEASVWACLFSFTSVFILWSLHTISVEIQNPFGQDANDLDEEGMQIEMNQHLLLLLKESTCKTPSLSPLAVVEDADNVSRELAFRGSFCDAWKRFQQEDDVKESSSSQSMASIRAAVTPSSHSAPATAGGGSLSSSMPSALSWSRHAKKKPSMERMDAKTIRRKQKDPTTANSVLASLTSGWGSRRDQEPHLNASPHGDDSGSALNGSSSASLAVVPTEGRSAPTDMHGARDRGEDCPVDVTLPSQLNSEDALSPHSPRMCADPHAFAGCVNGHMASPSSPSRPNTTQAMGGCQDGGGAAEQALSQPTGEDEAGHFRTPNGVPAVKPGACGEILT
eukprot:TRINITY_DN8026_c0_g1_i1.p1 TRINITY_DN8026_c0_g1~~TRINITY_DN8026_c0_g1_i1.p1  ORF type:complete len:651 (+),score=93.66 TRINITY_DN8026_c0_g1_i1:245-1954(+)